MKARLERPWILFPYKSDLTLKLLLLWLSNCRKLPILGCSFTWCKLFTLFMFVYDKNKDTPLWIGYIECYWLELLLVKSRYLMIGCCAVRNPPFKNFSNSRRRKPRHSVQNYLYLLVSLNITRNIVNVWKSNLSEYFLGRIQEHRNFRFTQTWDVSAEWGNLFCIVKTTCRKDAGLSAARLSFLALVSSYFSNFSYSFSWRCFRNCSFYAANIFVLSVCQLIRLSSLRVDFGRLSPKVSASLLVSWRSSVAERAI